MGVSGGEPFLVGSLLRPVLSNTESQALQGMSTATSKSQTPIAILVTTCNLGFISLFVMGLVLASVLIATNLVSTILRWEAKEWQKSLCEVDHLTLPSRKAMTVHPIIYG